MSSDVRDYLTAAEVAALLRVSKAKVYLLIATRQLGFLQVGRTKRIPREALDQFIRAHAVAADTPPAAA